MVQSLNLNAAARYSDYSLFGSQGTYKLGLDWQVFPSLKMRANRSIAFRVPNVPELFGDVSEANLTKTDSCNNWNSWTGLSHLFCSPSSFTRDPRTGEISFLSSQPANAAQQRVSGIDVAALYDFSLFSWTSSLQADVSRLNRFDVAPFPGGDVIEYAGKITGGRASYAKWRSTASPTMAKRAVVGILHGPAHRKG